MMKEVDAKKLAQHWVDAWNAHDIEEIMLHYGEEIQLTSPIAAKLLNDSTGIVKGKKALRAYFMKGLATYPDLRFELLDVMWGVSSVVLYYVNQNNTKTAELMELDSDGKVIRVIANYNV